MPVPVAAIRPKGLVKATGPVGPAPSVGLNFSIAGNSQYAGQVV